jgi:hypothetical protein
MPSQIFLKNRAVDSELLPCMDYLHGYVADDHFEAACYYEYSRESKILVEAARIYRVERPVFLREQKRRHKRGRPAGGRTRWVRNLFEDKGEV